MKKTYFFTFFALFIYSPMSSVYAATTKIEQRQAVYRSKDESVKGLLEAIGSSLKKPVIVSKAAMLKKISGEFVISNPDMLLDKISGILGLSWYFDGQSIYVYDGAENKNIIITLKNINYSYLQRFLSKSGLLDKKYPIKGDDLSNTFYLSGPPIYIDLIKKVVITLDQNQDNSINEKVVAIPLQHSFTEDRHYKYREDVIVIPGMARVISTLLLNSNGATKAKSENLADAKKNNSLAIPEVNALVAKKPDGFFSISSDPNTNSLLVQGTPEQILFVQKLVAMLDKPKRHIELSVWIVDIDKSIIDQLGVSWAASRNQGDFRINLNGTNQSSTLNGNRFLASIFALVQKKQANIVSRPLILTQENIPAVFDNSRTYYTKLVGERTANLQNITYGTAVNVLPRFTKKHEIELMLNIEDGSAIGSSPIDEYSALPIINKTNISTIARVPEGKSLLIGGYSKDEVSKHQEKIPLLGDIPLLGRFFRYENKTNSKSVRMFLIQPKEIKEALSIDTQNFNKGLISELKQKPLEDWVDLYLENELWQK